MKFSWVNSRIVFLVLIQIALIVVSVLILTNFESQNTLLGNSINVASSNVQLVDEVLFEMEKYRIGEPFVGTPTLALSNLNKNINVLKDGGNIRGLEISPLSKQFNTIWDELHVEYLNFASTSKQISNIKDSGQVISEFDILFLEDSMQEVSDKSILLANELTKYTEERSQILISLQIILAVVNVGAHIILIILIVSTLREELNQKLKIEKELQRKQIEIEKEKKEKFKILGQLAANLAHDIKNPLASMKHSLEIIQRKTKDDEITLKESQRADHAIKRIEHQVDRVLNYAKTQPLLKEDITVLTILKQTLALLTIPDNISVEIPEKDLDVKWDKTQISVVFTNIILNAIQAIGKNKGKISVRIFEENNTIKIEIENTGPNIPEKDLDKIFEPLYTTKMEGTGLGLAGCKNIIKTHKGTITISNNPVKFTIKIPKSL